MIGRTQELRTAIDLVVSGESVNIVSVRLNGRTTFLAELSKQLESRGWNVISVQGLVSLSSSPLTALQLANVQEETHSGATSALGRFSEGLRRLASAPQSVIIVDDWNDVDEASWGIIDHTRRTTGCSVVMSRLTGTTSNFTPTGLAGSAADASFVVTLPPLRFDELVQLLTARLGAPLDVATAGTIFRKTNGVIGLAVALADAAVREGHMRNVDGVWTAVEDLWSDGIAGLVEGYLEPLEGDALDALEMLSMIGTVDSNTLEELIEWDTVETLETRSYLSFYTTQSNDLVTVQPPLLMDYFLHLPMPARRRRLRAHLSEKLGGKAFPSLSQDLSVLVTTEQQPGADANFARLSTERLGARWLVAKSEWEHAPSQETGLAYILALLSINDPESQVAGIFAATQTPDSGDQIAVERALAYAMWIAIYQGELEAGLSLITETAQKYPKLARAATATAVLLETSMRAVPADYHELFEDTDGAPAWVVARVTEAQMIVLNAVGRFEDSIAMFKERAHSEQRVSFLPSAQYALALLGIGEHAAALNWSLRAYDEARATLDLPRLASTATSPHSRCSARVTMSGQTGSSRPYSRPERTPPLCGSIESQFCTSLGCSRYSAAIKTSARPTPEKQSHWARGPAPTPGSHRRGYRAICSRLQDNRKRL
ncbi:hypothetical protein G7067_04050 [Leucobacter insecticola]|uniref:Uncharacterized protein n=1 Tax=Leucobacter insecticola TaxID=2714934 RepID=A0A6G8FGZ5_9MICO|nr:hypothetical protein [Leucobacter insecticola]QIM15776.1 hypothetical protein G7067_04050 [Leucobacter insecticola]